jgi:hypothetical protein
VPRVAETVRAFTRQLRDDSVLAMPTGTFCTSPFPCPHLPQCTAKEPQYPLRHLPDLVRTLEDELHEEGIADLMQLDPKRPGLTFRQRRTLVSLRENTLLVEPFVREELEQIEYPLHFLSLVGVTEALPRFEGERPWQTVPYAWAAETAHENGRIERTAFVFADRGDPRPEFVRSLAKLLERGGMIACWCSDMLGTLRHLLDALPAEKQAVRAILGRPHIDLRRLLESGLFHPRLVAGRSLATVGEVVLGSTDFAALPIRDHEAMFSALQKASAPRVRQSTKDKIAAEFKQWVEWEARMLRALYRQMAGQGPETPAAEPAQKPAPARRKQLPRT